MSTVSLIHSTILNGKFIHAGEPIEESLLSENLRRYIYKPVNKPTKRGRHLSFELNRPYNLDGEGYLRGPASREAAQMEAEVSAEEAMTDELAEEPLTETLASAIEEARDGLQAEVERQKVQGQVNSKHTEEAEDALRQAQDEQVENGECDEWGPGYGPSKAPPPIAKAPAASVTPKRRSYVKRGSRFVLASMVRLVEGEPLYWHRKRSLGVAARFIAFGKVKKENLK